MIALYDNDIFHLYAAEFPLDGFAEGIQSGDGTVEIPVVVAAEESAVGTVVSGVFHGIEDGLHRRARRFVTVVMLEVGTGEENEGIFGDFRFGSEQFDERLNKRGGVFFRRFGGVRLLTRSQAERGENVGKETGEFHLVPP